MGSVEGPERLDGPQATNVLKINTINGQLEGLRACWNIHVGAKWQHH